MHLTSEAPLTSNVVSLDQSNRPNVFGRSRMLGILSLMFIVKTSALVGGIRGHLPSVLIIRYSCKLRRMVTNLIQAKMAAYLGARRANDIHFQSRERVSFGRDRSRLMAPSRV